MHSHATRTHQELLEEGLSINPGAVKGLSMSSEAIASHGQLGHEQLRRIREKEEMLHKAALNDYKVVFFPFTDYVFMYVYLILKMSISSGKSHGSEGGQKGRTKEGTNAGF